MLVVSDSFLNFRPVSPPGPVNTKMLIQMRSFTVLELDLAQDTLAIILQDLAGIDHSGEELRFTAKILGR